ncbi:NAD-dependent epimerase/dehydratase family protein [Saxibacter everestensis]|uniref:NAD-dependent epimerase/dehydratase family protein n=1 Tax=Saxibacter everestensis TaxID=2909229 RepID=A0ABY8QV78_9MICO|nr:NAD-dependent epimerase/dehydratase family protein [Brevibacteriaceae bacterium ZFBP1038]
MSASDPQGLIVVVTGGAGFIGANLVKRLLREPGIGGIRIFDDFSTGTNREFGDPRVEVFEGDLRDATRVDEVVRGASRIVHLGALPSVPRSIADPRSSIDVNIVGTLNVLEAGRAHEIEHVVVASSSSVYGANPILPKAESLATRPLSPYAVSKLGTEALANAYFHSFGLPTLAFRFFNVFGPLQRADHAYAAVIPKFLDAMKRSAPLTVFGDGTQSRDFTSVHLVVDALAKVSMQKFVHESPVNLAMGTRTTLNELIDLLRAIHPGQIDVEYVEPRAGDVPHSQASSELLTSLLPDLEAVAFEDSIREVYEWYFSARTSDPA